MIESADKWVRFLSGDVEAYSWIYSTYVQELYQFGFCFTSDTEMIKDCIQDLFVYIYMNREKIARPKNVKSYLLVSLKHNLLHAINYKEVPLDETNENDISQLVEKTVEESFIMQESQEGNSQRVNTILEMLTSRQREAIYYRFIQELSISEISVLMNTNYQSTQNLIQRALNKIREHYPDGLDVLLLFLAANRVGL